MRLQGAEKIPSRYRYMAGVLDGLRALGGTAEATQIYDWLIGQEIAYPNDLTTIQSDGGTRFHKEVRWARKELFDAELIDAPTRGVWALTRVGAETQLTSDMARMIVSARANERRRTRLHLHPSKVEGGKPNRIETSPQLSKKLLAGPTTGPVPVNWSGEITRTTNNPTWTYLMRFGERNIWKIGHTVDVAARLSELNRHVPTEVLQEAWTVVATFAWPNALQAYQIEQKIFEELSVYRSIGERLICCPNNIFAAWNLFSQTDGN